MKKLLVTAVFAVTVPASTALWAQEPGHEAKGAEHSEAAAHEEGDSLLVWRWANFVLLAAGLGWLISKSVPPMFRDRTAEIQKGIAEAAQVKADADKRAAAVDARLARLDTEIHDLREQSKLEMQLESSRIRTETANAIEKLHNQANAEIESAGVVARNDLKAYAAQLALDMAEQRIRARMNGNAEGALIDAFVNDLGRGAKN
jgi:F-type H+-transporting ATPase subunit b